MQDHHGRQMGFLDKFIGEARTPGISLKLRELDLSMEREHAMPCNFKKEELRVLRGLNTLFFKKRIFDSLLGLIILRLKMKKSNFLKTTSGSSLSITIILSIITR